MKLSNKDKFRVDFDDGTGPAGHISYNGVDYSFHPSYPITNDEMKSVIKIIEKLEKDIKDD